MDIRKMKKEATLYSIEGEENATYVKYADCNDSATNLQRDCNDITTSSQRNCDDIAKQKQTFKATLQRLFDNGDWSKDKSALVIKENTKLYKLLTTRGFIKNVTGIYKLHTLNINVPDPLVDAVNKEGCVISKEKLSKFILCMRIQRRFKISTVILINLFWISALILAIYNPEVKASVKETSKIEVISAAFSENESALDTAIREWEHSTGKKIYPAGRKALERASVGMKKDEIINLINRNVK
ncbi:MAG: hypothetical protein K5685_13695 [Bacteroidales bacterium]|nr:hypothetical protein [Bacteroidales bacterium]